MTMRKRIIIALAILAAAGLAVAQDARTDQVTVPLTNPGKPARVVISTFFGTIKVTGYDGKDVLITAKPREKSLNEGRAARTGYPTVMVPPDNALRAYVDIGRAYSGTLDKDKEKEKKEKSAGMKQIPLESSGLTAEEEDNKVSIRFESYRRAYDLEVKVPVASALEVKGSNLDAITVENVSGEIDVSTHVGDAKLLNVAGPVTVNSTNGDIEVVLSKAALDKPMSFVSFFGDIDLTLPADAKASFRIKSVMGDLFTDFDLALKTVPAEAEKSSTRESGRFRVSLDRSVFGTINGGGAEIKIQNNNGNVYIRKKK
jgi:hypothetical protein